MNTCECTHLLTEHDQTPAGNPGACQAPSAESSGDAWGSGRCDCVLFHPAEG